MKATAIFLAFILSVALGKHIQLNKSGCPEDYTIEQLYPHAECHKFYQCFHGDLIVHHCAANLYFNIEKQLCDFPSTVNCGDRIIPKPDEGNESSPGDNNESGDSNCNCSPSEASSICAKDGSDDILIAHKNCNQFYKCSNNVPVSQWCPKGLLYNPNKEYCDWAENVNCGDRVIADIDNEENGDGNEADDNNGESDGNDSNGGGGGNDNPAEAPSICAKDESDGILVAHENCNQFYKCSNNVPVSQWCPKGLLYNSNKEYCDWAENVNCGDRVIADIDNEENGDGNEADDNNGESDGNDSNGGGGGNDNPAEAPSICAKDESDGILVAHENCNQFYKCSNNVPVSQWCPKGLLYNPNKEYCDWAENVNCGDRVIADIDNEENGDGNEADDNNGESDGNDSNGGGGGNDNPAEAPSICAKDESDGILVAHENCNQFYKCSNNVPVSQWCPKGLLYNPNKEYCDWAENVNCGDRVIADIDNEENGDGNEADDNNGESDGNDSNGGGGGNDNPAEAPSICAKDESDGILVAHENCNQFYKCSNNVPVSQWCPKGLLYNSNKEYCDWAENVNCGDRVIADIDNEENGDGNEADDNNGESDGNDSNGGGGGNDNPAEAPSICAKDESDGILVAHENCNQFYKCSNNVPVSQWCPKGLLYNSNKEYCDWAENVNCGDRVIADIDNEENGDGNEADDNNGESDGNDSNGGGGGNDNPAEAPSICAKDESDGILVAHENCNQFYKCSNNVPVSQWCPKGLLYNPNKEYCDWAENVNCGDRVIADIDNEENGDGNEADDNNGESDGNDSNGGGGGNDNPAEAPSICAKDESDGILVAHENCNQFYKCSNNVPVSQWCPKGLLYNPNKEYCDWAENVNCGDRVIADIDNEENGDGNEADDNNGESDGNDSNGGGGGNDNPAEAPSICAKDESDGILVAHEHCNQFYKCSNNVPVSQWCPKGLLYNPNKEYCDWPQNVDCGERIISDSGDDQ